MRRGRLVAGLALLLAACGQPTALSPAATASGTPKPTPARTPSPAPARSPAPTPTPIAPPNLPVAGGIRVPAGFTAYRYAGGPAFLTSMAFGPDGRLYATTSGGAVLVVPAPGAGSQVLVAGLPVALGMAWRGNDLFVSVRGSVRGYQLSGGGLAGGGAVVAGLPVGRHQNNAIVLLPNGDFLLGVGSTCDVCLESDGRSAAVLRFHGDWTYAGVVVRGSRNPYGLALRPSTGDAYVTINGQDNLGSQPADDMLLAANGVDAGWPRCWPSYPDGGLHGNCAGVAPPVAVFQPHTSADGMAIYEGNEFGMAYVDNAFVTEWGDNAGTSIGRKVMRVVLSGLGPSQHGQVSDFATGFSHPLAITVAPDGGLLVGDYGSGQIVEIFRTG